MAPERTAFTGCGKTSLIGNSRRFCNRHGKKAPLKTEKLLILQCAKSARTARCAGEWHKLAMIVVVDMIAWANQNGHCDSALFPFPRFHASADLGGRANCPHVSCPSDAGVRCQMGLPVHRAFCTPKLVVEFVLQDGFPACWDIPFSSSRIRNQTSLERYRGTAKRDIGSHF